MKVRQRHHLEREIAKLEVLPKNEERAKTIRLLKKRLALL
jgi:hypothetical protein